MTWPAAIHVEAILRPADAFGASSPSRPRNLLVRGTADARVHFNSNTGRIEVESDAFLPPLAYAELLASGWQLTLTANVLGLDHAAGRPKDLGDALKLAELVVPAYLSVAFGTYVGVDAITGGIHPDYEFRYELAYFTTTLNTQDEPRRAARVKEAVAWASLAAPAAGRVTAGMLYYQQVLRLLAPSESRIVALNVGEIILNLAKCVQALLGESRDEVRAACRRLGYSESQIEGQVIPLLLGRDKLDVAHASVRRVPAELVEVVRAYVDRCLLNVRSLLVRTARAVAGGEEIVDAPGPERDESDDKIKLLRKLREYLAEPALPLE